MDLFARHPVNVPSSPETVEVDDNAVKEEKKLKESMVQELTAFTTHPVESTTTNATKFFSTAPSSTSIPPEILRSEDSHPEVAQNFSSSTEAITSFGTTTSLSEVSPPESSTTLSTFQAKADPNRATTSSFDSEASTVLNSDFHEAAASDVAKIVPTSKTKTLNPSPMTISSSPEILNSIDAVVSVTKEDVNQLNVPLPLPVSSTTSSSRRTTNQEAETDSAERRNVKVTTKLISRHKTTSATEMTSSPPDIVSSTAMLSLNNANSFSSGSPPKEEKPTTTTEAAVTKLVSPKGDTTFITPKAPNDHQKSSSGSPSMEEAQNESLAYSTTTQLSSEVVVNHLTSLSTMQKTTGKITVESTTLSAEQPPTTSSMSVSGTSLMIKPTSKSITDTMSIPTILTTTDSTTKSIGSSAAISSNPDLMSTLRNPLLSKSSTELTTVSTDTEHEHERKAVDVSLKSTEHSTSTESTRATSLATSTSTSSAASSSILMKKLELLPSHRDLPERWKALVLRLKKKLEALKAQTSLLSATSSESPTTKAPSKLPDSSIDESTTTDTSVKLSTKTLTDSTNTSERQILESGEVVGSPTSTVLMTTFLSPTPTVTTTLETSATKAFSKISETTDGDISPTQNEEPNGAADFTSTVTITSSTGNAFRRDESTVRESTGLPSTMISSVISRRSDGLGENVREVTDFEVSEETSLETAASNISSSTKISSTQQNIIADSNQEQIFEKSPTTDASLATETRTTPESTQYSSVNGSTESTIDLKKTSSSSMTTEFIDPSSLPNITIVTKPESTTRSQTKDIESVGGFVISKMHTSSEEVLESIPKTQQESTDPTDDPLSKNNSVSFMIGQSVEKINILSSIIKDILRGVPLMTTTTTSTTVKDETDVMNENDKFEKRIREERIRYEQAKHSRDDQLLRGTTIRGSKGDETLREELVRRSEELQRRIESLKAEETTRLHLLEEQQRREEERLRKIALENEQRKFAEFTSTVLPLQETVTKRIRYRLRPAQCVAINKFTRVFNITDPSLWIAKNCQLAKRYFPQASCPQIQSLIESCFAFV